MIPRPRGTPPGLYMVLIFDGGEGGAHNTWDYLHVIDPAGPEDNAGLQPTAPFRPPDSNRRPGYRSRGRCSPRPARLSRRPSRRQLVDAGRSVDTTSLPEELRSPLLFDR
jgi:hypothetical protein